MGVRTPETCWVVHKRQNNKLEKLLHLVGWLIWTITPIQKQLKIMWFTDLANLISRFCCFWKEKNYTFSILDSFFVKPYNFCRIHVDLCWFYCGQFVLRLFLLLLRKETGCLCKVLCYCVLRQWKSPNMYILNDKTASFFQTFSNFWNILLFDTVYPAILTSSWNITEPDAVLSVLAISLMSIFAVELCPHLPSSAS